MCPRANPNSNRNPDPDPDWKAQLVPRSHGPTLTALTEALSDILSKIPSAAAEGEDQDGGKAPEKPAPIEEGNEEAREAYEFALTRRRWVQRALDRLLP